ncbi:MAG: hypothetical protein KDE53_41070, partial [Caldilineaceae bacterium]|nr:hypothetical protein [Caldilineaceae bacterium]
VEINQAILTNGTDQALMSFAEVIANSISVSCGFPSGCSVHTQPNAPLVASLQSKQILRQAAMEVDVNDATLRDTVRQLILDTIEAQIDLEIAAQEFDAQMTYFNSLIAETERLMRSAQRARKYVEDSKYNDPSFRLVRDSARLQLADKLQLAEQYSYMAARRAEYEYALPLSAVHASYYDIYQARTAGDILAFLDKLKQYENVAGAIEDAEQTKEDYTISVAYHILGLTDEYLQSTGNNPNVRAERVKRFREWAAKHTVQDEGGKPVLRFSFSSSIADGGILSRALNQSYDEIWLHRIAGVGVPKPDSTGLWIQLQTEQAAALRYRVVKLEQAGATHLRSSNGCIHEYPLIHPQALLGLGWQDDKNPFSTVAIFNAHAGTGNGEFAQRTEAFYGRPVLAGEWNVEIRSGSPDGILADMDLQMLTDIEFHFSTTRATSPASLNPNPDICAQMDP